MNRVNFFILVFIICLGLFLNSLKNKFDARAKSHNAESQLEDEVVNQDSPGGVRSSLSTPQTSSKSAQSGTQVNTNGNSNPTPPPVEEAREDDNHVAMCYTQMMNCRSKEVMFEYPSEEHPWSQEEDQKEVECLTFKRYCKDKNAREIPDDEEARILAYYNERHQSNRPIPTQEEHAFQQVPQPPPPQDYVPDPQPEYTPEYQQPVDAQGNPN